MSIARTLGRVAPTSASSLRVSLWRIPRTRSLLAIGTIAALGGMVALAAHVYTDLLWYQEVGQEQVFWTTLKWKVLVRLVIGLGTATFLLANFAVADRAVAAHVRQGDALAPTRLWAYRNLLFPLAAIAGGLAANRWAAGGVWQSLLLWLNRGDFGVADPQFHRDVGFYVFSMPLYQQVGHWLHMTLLTAGAGVVGAYVAAGAIRISEPRIVTRAARTHLLALGALLLVLMAWRYRLDQFALVLQHEDAVVPGATYTDVHVRLPILRTLMWLSVAGAVLCLYAAWRRVSLPVGAAAGAVVIALVGVAAAGGSVTNLVEHLAVDPQALSRERPYVTDSIAFTRKAFQLDGVRVRPMSGEAKLTDDAIAQNRDTLDNVSLWDSSVLQPAMDELQSIATYYRFGRATVDRYTVGGRPRLLTLAERQLDLEEVKPDARSWANERFAYTHGYGVVATEAQEVDNEQQPGFAEANRTSLRLREPRIYYGERPDFDPPYMVLRTSRGEVEERAGGSQRAEYHYSGQGGIRLSNPLRRFAFAARFGDPKLLLTQTVNTRSRIVMRRDARERLDTLAPFVGWGTHPQTAVIGGRVQFLFHGYTTSSHYPYSASVRLGGSRVNYIRAAALGVVDAFTGRIDLYATDPADPILRAWRAAYPTLFQPESEMPGQLREHLLYPGRLFEAQVKAYSTYHVDNPDRFWTAEDAWQRSLQLAGPIERAGEVDFPNGENGPPKRPEYQLARLPGDARERFMLAMPFTPRDRQNLAGYLAGSVDERGRPRLTLLNLPRDRPTIGPTQATRRILANSGVSRRLDLTNRESRDLGENSVSRTVLGAPRLVPVGDALLHVQPFFLIAGENGVPRLQLVTVHVNDRVGYGSTLRAALRRAMGPGSSR